jgi:hypothetical protein
MKRAPLSGPREELAARPEGSRAERDSQRNEDEGDS